MCALHSTLYTLHSTLYTLHSTLHTLHFTLYTLHSTLYTLHSTLYTLHVQSVLLNVHLTAHFSLPLHPLLINLYTLLDGLNCTLHFTLYTTTAHYTAVKCTLVSEPDLF